MCYEFLSQNHGWTDERHKSVVGVTKRQRYVDRNVRTTWLRTARNGQYGAVQRDESFVQRKGTGCLPCVRGRCSNDGRLSASRSFQPPILKVTRQDNLECNLLCPHMRVVLVVCSVCWRKQRSSFTRVILGQFMRKKRNFSDNRGPLTVVYTASRGTNRDERLYHWLFPTISRLERINRPSNACLRFFPCCLSLTETPASGVRRTFLSSRVTSVRDKKSRGCQATPHEVSVRLKK